MSLLLAKVGPAFGNPFKQGDMMNKHVLVMIGCAYITMAAGESTLFQSLVIKHRNGASAIRAFKKPKLCIFNQKNLHATDKQDVEHILASFAAVMQCFFNIVQEPKNKQKIALNVANMFLNFLNASKVIVKGSDILLDTDKQKVRDLLTIIDTPPSPAVSAIFVKKNS